MLKAIIDPIIKVAFSLVATFLSQRVIAVGVVALLEKLAKRTSNTVDDKMVETWKEELKKSGLPL